MVGVHVQGSFIALLRLSNLDTMYYIINALVVASSHQSYIQ